MAPGRGRIVVALTTLAAAGACAPQAVSEQGRAVTSLYWVFFAVAAVIFSITSGLIAWSLLRYRARSSDEGRPSQFKSHVGLEIVWFVIPQLIVVGLFIASTTTLWNTDPEPQGDDGLTIEVTAFQWGWRFAYPDGVEVSGDVNDPPSVTVPTDRPVTFELAATDVVHSFYVPKFFIKRDAVPGRTTRIEVTVEEAGTYRGFCAEFCGDLHAGMTFSIEAVPPAEFEQWLSEQERSNGDG